MQGNPVYYKDDIESLIYMCIYFLKGSLPWSDLMNSHFKNSSSFNKVSLEEIKKENLKQKSLIPLE